MARISSHQHLKPQVFESFHNGGTPNRIIAQFGIPKSTAYNWYQQMCVEYDEITVASEIDINYFAYSSENQPALMNRILVNDMARSVARTKVVDQEREELTNLTNEYNGKDTFTRILRLALLKPSRAAL